MKNKIIGILSAIIILLGGGVAVNQGLELGGGRSRLVNVHTGITATTTSAAINISSAEKVTLYVTQQGTGAVKHEVEVSLDGTTFVDYDKLIDNVANTNSQDITRVASKSFAAAGTETLDIDMSTGIFDSFRVVTSVSSTTASSTVQALIKY